MNHFFVGPDAVKDGQVIIRGGDVNHIRNVLRMKVGDDLLISDGQGTDYTCRIESIGEEILCSVNCGEASITEPSCRFYLFQGLPKADKLEHVIQKSVELGVYEIIPVEMSRSVVKYDDKKAQTRRERWQKIAEGAAKQSRRGIIPEVRPVMKFADAIKYAGDLDIILMPYENFKDMTGTRKVLSEIKPGMSVGIFVGPEGGIDEKEVERAQAQGARLISLGSRILRTETAPLMLLSVLTFAMEE